MEHDEITRQIIGCAYRVYNTMGHGFLESVYENCMLVELRKLGLHVENQRPIKVYYDGHVVGNFEADLFVENMVIVELKAVGVILRIHEVQLVNYLKATGIDVGLLLNFGDQRVEVRRKLRVLPEADDPE
jgi:GxxExxY protein